MIERPSVESVERQTIRHSQLSPKAGFNAESFGAANEARYFMARGGQNDIGDQQVRWMSGRRRLRKRAGSNSGDMPSNGGKSAARSPWTHRFSEFRSPSVGPAKNRRSHHDRPDGQPNVGNQAESNSTPNSPKVETSIARASLVYGNSKMATQSLPIIAAPGQSRTALDRFGPAHSLIRLWGSYRIRRRG
jgi:hypothetical protein